MLFPTAIRILRHRDPHAVSLEVFALGSYRINNEVSHAFLEGPRLHLGYGR